MGLIISICLIGLALLIVLLRDVSLTAIILFVIGWIGLMNYSSEDETQSENETISQDEINTELIHRYQKGDYSLEFRIDGDKVDTLYIFK